VGNFTGCRQNLQGIEGKKTISLKIGQKKRYFWPYQEDVFGKIPSLIFTGGIAGKG
jgi:hypothetical protein